jgi:multiple antibiotic resistance protein
MAFIAISNPIANAPVFLGLTANLTSDEKKRVALKATIYAYVIVAVFALVGSVIFEVFGITIPAFKIAGALILTIIGLHMLSGNKSSVQHPSGDVDTTGDIAMTPLALPILSGPGAIATAINFAPGHGVFAIVATLACYAVVMLLNYFAFIYVDRIIKLFGKSAMDALTRIMGMILMAIGIQMGISGIEGVYTGFIK